MPYREKLGGIIQDILLSDSSIHSALFRIVCTTAQGLEVSLLLLCISFILMCNLFYHLTVDVDFPSSLQKLYISRLYEVIDIEGVQLAISRGLEVLSSMLSVFSKVCQEKRLIFRYRPLIIMPSKNHISFFGF